jgi:hypothetical protein
MNFSTTTLTAPSNQVSSAFSQAKIEPQESSQPRQMGSAVTPLQSAA